jgi:hypothetical protein
LLAEPAMQPYLDELDAENFTWRWSHPDPRMDVLQREVSAIAARAAGDDDDPATGWLEIRSAADRAAGATSAPVPPPLRGFAAGAHAPPRLTEAWFC